jgi:hypothetical protein
MFKVCGRQNGRRKKRKKKNKQESGGKGTESNKNKGTKP